MDIQSILAEGSAHLIDVREVYEYDTDHIDGAINIPLSQIDTSIATIRALEGAKVLYCRSGNRSDQATQFCKSMGITEVYNGGSMQMVRNFLIDA